VRESVTEGGLEGFFGQIREPVFPGLEAVSGIGLHRFPRPDSGGVPSPPGEAVTDLHNTSGVRGSLRRRVLPLRVDKRKR